MNKIKQVKSQLARRIAINVGLILLLGGATIGVYMVEQDHARERTRITGSINQINANIQNMDATFKKAKASLDLYEQLQQSENAAESALSRANIASLLNTMKDRYRLDNLTLRMTPVKDIEDRRFITDTTTVIQTEITLTFSGITDEILFGFISEVLQQLPGYTRVSFLRMKREGEITDNFLDAVNREEYPALVSGEIAFHLLGMKKTGGTESADNTDRRAGRQG